LDIFQTLAGGVGQLADPMVWVMILIGTVFGVIAGALPGIGATLGYGLVLPFTFVMSPEHAVAFLLSISVGVMYGNSIPAILMGVPGNPSAVLTVIDGHTLFKRGEGSLALGVAFVAALGAQFISILFFVVLVVPLTNLAYVFLAPELFALLLLGMVAIVSLTGKNVLKGLLAAAFGLGIGIVGLDPINLTARFDFGFRVIRSGFEIVPVVIGLLAVSELFRMTRQVYQWENLSGVTKKNKFPPWSKLKPTIPAILGGTVVGTLVGAIPGAGATPAAMIAYQQAQLFSKHPEEFGNGSIEGIAANEAAQNASNSGELIPTLALGIPGSGSMVLLLSALTVHGFIPGPRMTEARPELLYAAIAGLLAATLFLVLTGWWMASLMLKAVTLNRSGVIVFSLAVVILGVFSLNGRIFDVAAMIVFGLIGYFMLRYGYSTAGAALAVVLGKLFEQNLRQGLSLTRNSWGEFFARPITATVVAIAVIIFLIGIYRQFRLRQRMRG